MGDGSIASGPTVTHTYMAVGSYTATVTATNSSNRVSATTVISLVDVPIAGLLAVNDSPTLLGRPTAFTASISAGTNVTYGWVFGDGDIAAGPAVTHAYTGVGSYMAFVTAANSASHCAATTSVTISARHAQRGVFLPVVLRPN